MLATLAVLFGYCDRLAAAAPDAPGDVIVAAQLATAQMMYRGGGFAAAAYALELAMGPQEFAQLSPSKRYEVSLLYGRAAWAIGAYGRAHRGFRAATDTPLATPDDWRLRMIAAAKDDDAADAYLAFQHIRSQWPKTFDDLPSFMVLGLDRTFGDLPDGAKARSQLAAVLVDRPWSNDDPLYDQSSLWLHAAVAAIEAHNSSAAAAYAHRITSPFVMAALRADRRFDAIVAADPETFDVRAVAERQIKLARGLAEQQPRSMAAQYAVVRALYALGRPEEALDVIDEAIAKAKPNDDPWSTAYPDAPFVIGGALNWKAAALSQLGRDDQAEALLEAANVEGCSCSGSDAQVAGYLTDLGRANEALPLVEGKRQQGLDPQDMMDLARTRARVYAALGRAAPLAEQVAYLRAHRSAKPEALVDALLCANDVEGAAAELIGMLHDPYERSAALSELLTYHDRHLRPGAQVLQHRIDEVAARDDVRAAVAQVGRLSAYDMPRYSTVS